MSRSPSGSRSGSASGSASGSGSRSTSPSPSDDSVTLPSAPVAAAPVLPSDAPVAPQEGVVSLFIGLGPAGRKVTEEAFTAFLRAKVGAAEDLVRVAMRGRSAFVDVANQAVADMLVNTLNDQPFNEEVRLVVQAARHSRAELIERRKARESAVAVAEAQPDRPLLFIGLGPKGADVTDADLRAKVEAITPITSFRRRPQWAIIGVATMEDAAKVIAACNNEMMGECRLSVQISNRDRSSRAEDSKSKSAKRGRVSRRSRSHSRDRRRGRDDRRSRRDRRSRSRSRSRSPRRRHRRRERSVSSSSSYSRRRSYSRSDSEERRDRRRRRR